MSSWLTDPELFLYVKGIGPDDVHLWRCKKPASSSSSSSSLVVPMKPDDFEYVSNVKNHLELIADLFDWDATDYKRLVKYIFERRLLVNSHGFVIAELLHKLADKDGNKTMDVANEDEDIPAMYIRSLDVLPLKPYIPKLRERPIPLRTVKYLDDVNGKAAMMEEDSNITKLTARVADLESKNKTLEVENKTLEGKVTKLTADLVTQMTALTTLQQEVKNINSNNKEVWMNELTNSEWVGVEGLNVGGPYDNFIIVGSLGTYTMDDSSTNVQARYLYQIKIDATSNVFKAVSLEDLIPNTEKARFEKNYWWSTRSKGKTYVCRY